MPYEAVVESAKALSFDERVSLISALALSLKNTNNGTERTEHVEKKDFRDTYPAGFWDLFGSAPDFPAEPEEIPWEYDTKRESFDVLS